MLRYPGKGGVGARGLTFVTFGRSFHLQPFFVHERVAKALASLYLYLGSHKHSMIVNIWDKYQDLMCCFIHSVHSVRKRLWEMKH